jgi:hypothetical protein
VASAAAVPAARSAAAIAIAADQIVVSVGP